MKVTKYGHACLLIEEGGQRVLIDPGAFSKGFEGLTGLGAVLVTHQHSDHLVPENVMALQKNNPDMKVYGDEGSAAVLGGQGIEVVTVHAGDEFYVGEVPVNVYGRDHAVIHPDIPGIPDVGYMVGERLFYPGDAFTVPDKPVEILAIPLGAPWLKVSEVVDYARRVAPKVAIPVHDAVLAMPDMHIGILQRLTQETGLEVRVLEHGHAVEL